MNVYTTLTVLLLFLLACTTPPSDKKIFRMNQVQNVETLDPAFAKNQYIMWHVNQCYNRLIEFDEHMNPQPSLAKSWSVSDDRTVYTFILRNDVFFHHNPAFIGGVGRKMTASDVVYSFSRIIDEKTASSGAWIFNDRVDSVQPFVAINDTTFEMHLLRPFNPMLGIVSMMYCSIVPHEVVEKWGKDFRSHPCGTGPFVFQDWEEAVAITYRKNEHYWERDSDGHQLPYIDGIKFSQVDSKATEFLLFMQGDIDFMNSNYGFDRAKMITYIRNNIGIPANAGIIPISLKGYDSNLVKGYSYQPERAKQLLAEVKKAMGYIPSITLLSNDNYADRCTFIASQLKDIGLDVKIEILQPSLLREQMSNSNANFFWATWIADYPDAECYLTMFYGKNTAPPNYTRFKNEAFDKLYEQCLVERDEQKKIAAFQQMDRIIIEEAPCVPLFYDEVMHFVQNRVTNFNTNSSNLIDLKRVRLDDIPLSSQ